LRKIIIFNLLLLKHIATALFKKLPSQDDRIYCLGEWEIISLEDERGEDENGNDRFTNLSFFFSEIGEFFLIWEERRL